MATIFHLSVSVLTCRIIVESSRCQSIGAMQCTKTAALATPAALSILVRNDTLRRGHIE
jgi:hypothetical protein